MPFSSMKRSSDTFLFGADMLSGKGAPDFSASMRLRIDSGMRALTAHAHISPHKLTIMAGGGGKCPCS